MDTFSVSINIPDDDIIQPITVLVVDDAETDRQTYRRYLTKATDCNLLEADNGEDGLTLAQNHQPDVILLDYLLPDIDGLEFLQLLYQALTLPPPVIMLTGEGNEQVAVEAMKAGAQDYLVKGSLRPHQLVQTVYRVLNQQRLQQRLNRQRQQQQLMAEIALSISQSLDLVTLLNTAVEGIRQLLDCDRTLAYRFESDFSGTVMAEAILPGWTTSLGSKIEDTCFQNQGTQHYLNGHKTVIADIHNSHLTACHIELLEQFQVKANIVVPIILPQAKDPGETQLWGLLIAHHCRNTRQWQADELALLDSLAVQLTIAIQQSELVLALNNRAKALSKTNQKLLKTTELLKSRNEELDQFAYIASHDLKAPLRAISNLSEWLQEDLSGQIPAENQQQLNLMQSRVQRLETFIEGLLQYSRAGRQGMDICQVDVRDLIEDIIDELAPPKTLRLSIPEVLPTLQTQQLLLRQVFANLVGNAIKYHHGPEGRITLTAQDVEDFFKFNVIDDGPGIAPEHHDRIFGVFQTLASRDSIESTGIGLSIVKKLVEQQGGEISLQSAPGEGSCFSFTWPKHSQLSSPQ